MMVFQKNSLWAALALVVCAASVHMPAEAAAAEKSAPFDKTKGLTFLTLFGGAAAIPDLYFYKNLCKDGKLMRLDSVLVQSAANSDASVTNFYKWLGPDTLRLELSKDTNIHALKEEIEKNKILKKNWLGSTVSWSDNNWDLMFRSLTNQEDEQAKALRRALGQEKMLVNLDKIPELLQDGQRILASFLPNTTTDLCESNFVIKKTVCRRLFTYAKLQEVINEKKLSHIHLPLKLLVIKDKKNNEYVTDKKRATLLMNDMFKAGISSDVNVAFDVEPSDDYEVEVWAEEKAKSKVPLSNEAMADLRELVKEAPFDIGRDNIFSDSNGDAVIIDTEYKGESAETSLAKLSRYKS